MELESSQEFNENELKKLIENWLEQSKKMGKQYGKYTAIAFIIGHKFYSLMMKFFSIKKMMTYITEERKNPNYDPVYNVKLDGFKLNLDEEYQKEEKKAFKMHRILVEFSNLIKNSYEKEQLWVYFNSNPVLGVMGYLSETNDKLYKYNVEEGLLNRPVEVEQENNLLLKEMKQYF